MHRPQVAFLFAVLIAFNGAQADSAERGAAAARGSAETTASTAATPRTTAASRNTTDAVARNTTETPTNGQPSTWDSAGAGQACIADDGSCMNNQQCCSTFCDLR